MNRFQELQDKHIVLLRRYETNKESAEFIKDVQEYTQQVVNASREINDSRERNQLRANLRFWGAYIYDHTGTYPNLSLLPAESKPVTLPPKARAGNIVWIIIGSLVFLTIVVLAVVFRGYRFFADQAHSQQPTVTNMPMSPTPGMSDVLVFATDTAPAVQSGTAVVDVVTATPQLGGNPVIIPTPTPTIIALPTDAMTIPTATLGVMSASAPASSIASTGFIPSLTYPIVECSQRKIAVAWRDFEWDTSLLPSSSAIESAVAYLSLPGSGDILAQMNVIPNGDPAILEVGNTNSDQSYFLQVKHSNFLFEPMIVQFTSDCAYNHIAITYGGRSNLIDQSTLDMGLTLVDWGPNSLSSPFFWIAELSIRRDAGGIYMYNRSPIKENTFFVSGHGCSPAPFTLGRANNGKYQEVAFSLYLAGPLCPGTDE